MARPRIRPSARSIPISFSVKPDLAAKIDEYSHQIRFSRSKFLAQAVTEAITKIEMGYDLSDFDVRNMTDSQKLAIALNTLNEPTPEQEINLNIARILRDKLNELLGNAPIPPSTPAKTPRTVPSSSFTNAKVDKEVQIIKGTPRGTGGSLYVVHVDEQPVAEIEKELNKWLLTDLKTGELVSMHRTLKSAKAQATMDYE
jgi:hypothetical protein